MQPSNTEEIGLDNGDIDLSDYSEHPDSAYLWMADQSSEDQKAKQWLRADLWE